MPTEATYRIGAPTRPTTITHDNGHLDQFPSRRPNRSDRLAYANWMMKLEGIEAVQGVPLAPKNDISDALAAYRHFMGASGTTRTIALDRYLANDRSGQILLRNAKAEAMEAAVELYDAVSATGRSFRFTGSALQVSSQSLRWPYPATENWQKALGAFPFWLSGTVRVSPHPTDMRRDSFEMRFTIHMEDRYNFNPGEADIATKIPDAANGRFEITGLARQYMNVGTASRTVTWQRRDMPGQTEVAGGPDRRVRQPNDNRRVRNRL